MNDRIAAVADLIAAHADTLFTFEDVVGVGEGEHDGAPCIRVYLARDNAATVAALPDKLGEIPVIPEVSGTLHARR